MVGSVALKLSTVNVMTQIQGATVLITGANGGLGRAIAQTLAAEGANLIVTGRREKAVEEIAKMVNGKALIADLSQRSSLASLIEQAGPIDVLIANAALPATGELDSWSEEDMDRILEVNLGSPIALTRLLLPSFRERNSGHLVYISSLSGKIASQGASLYSATKFGLRGFAGALRADLLSTGIGVSTIFPGFVRDAGMFADSGVRLPRGVGTVTPHQVADAVVAALRHNRGEIDVAPMGLRASALAAGIAPSFVGRVQAKVGTKISAELAQAQRHKR